MKPDMLTPDEYARTMQHCHYGSQICEKVPFLKPEHDIAYQHHEFYDGNGYSDGIATPNIPFDWCIVVDAYDAMTSDRPCRRAQARDGAFAILEPGSGTRWDLEIVRCFVDCTKGVFQRLSAA
jgi:HD-GYP domain-containing protein (c-di-GMP phosphodiesterase class II)